MKVEYLHDLTDGGKYKQVISKNLVRLYGFSPLQTLQFTQMMEQTLLIDNRELDLSSVDFIVPLNCQLTMRLSAVDNGILKTKTPDIFICELTRESFITAIKMMKAVESGYHWLCDTSDDGIDFLYSSGRTW